MAYKHGIYTSEQATSLVSMTQTDSGLIVAVGTAPVHLASAPADANTPVLCYTYKEAVAALGYSDDWGKYTLCEMMKTHFTLFNMAPIVLINVLDKNKNAHKIEQAKSYNIEDGVVKVTEPMLVGTLSVKASADAATPFVLDTDYTAAYDDDGAVVVTPIAGGAISSEATSLYLTYTMLNPAGVTNNDIIGGINITTNKAEGLELVEEVYPRFGLAPGIIVAPGWSHNTAVAAVMKAKEHGICGHFNAISLCDIPTDTVKSYTQASEWKNNNNFADKDCLLCWPMLFLF